MPIYKTNGKKDGLQKYRVRVNYVDSFGEYKQIERVAYGKDAAKELESRLVRDLKEESCKKITLNELYDEYIIAKQCEVRENSMRTIRGRLSLYVLPMLGNYRIDKLNTAILQKWKQYVESCKNQKKPSEKISPSMKKSIYGELRALLNYAVKMEYIPKNPLAAVGNFRNAYETKKEMDFYTAEEFKMFISEALKQAEESERINNSIFEWHFYVFFSVAFYTGMRKGEINVLKWTDIDGDIIHVRRSIAQKLKGADRETPPKNKSSIRDLQIPEPLKNILAEHYNRCKQINGFSDDWRICGCTSCLRDTTIQHRNERYAKAAGLKIIRIHDFRHSHASLLANNGINIQEIARRLGHSKIEITWDIYSHLYPREEERAIEVLNRIV